MVGERLDQLSRIEDKTARIEEKYARTETGMLRVQDKVEAAMARMTDAALQSDLVVVRERVEELGRRVRGLPGLNSLWLTAIVTALLTAVVRARGAEIPAGAPAADERPHARRRRSEGQARPRPRRPQRADGERARRRPRPASSA